MFQKTLKISIHVIVWLLFIFSPFFFFDNNPEELYSQNRLFTIGLVVIFFYLNYFVLIPQLTWTGTTCKPEQVGCRTGSHQDLLHLVKKIARLPGWAGFVS